MDEDVLQGTNDVNGDVSMTYDDTRHDERMRSPVLPPSPVSRPVSPSRKRPRLATWNPPAHIPDFLPPFPTTVVTVNGSSSRAPTPQPQIKQEAEAATPSSADMAADRDRDRIPTTVMPQQLATAASAADYLTPVPYNMSSLSSAPEMHLPDRSLFRRCITEAGSSLQLQPRKHQVPEVDQALMGAYHHLLTNPSPRTPSTNPNRHRVALTLMAQAYLSPRWTSTDSLFGCVAPPRPRVVAPAPTYPILLASKKDEQVPILPSASKTIAPPETVVPLTSQVRSRIPSISKATLPVSKVTINIILPHSSTVFSTFLIYLFSLVSSSEHQSSIRLHLLSTRPQARSSSTGQASPHHGTLMRSLNLSVLLLSPTRRTRPNLARETRMLTLMEVAETKGRKRMC